MSARQDMNTTAQTGRRESTGHGMGAMGILVTAAVICAAALGTPLRADRIDGIVAVVDDKVVMYSDVVRKIQELGGKTTDPASVRQVLQIMIEDIVVNKVYRTMGMSQVDPRQAENYARETGVDTSTARTMIMKMNLMELMVKSRVVITETMILEYYNSRAEYTGSEAVHLKQILIKGDPAKAEKAMAEIRGGKAFDEAARDHSDVLVDGSADIGWVELVHLAPDALKVLRDARPGDVVGPVKLGENTLIYQVLERGTTGAKPLEDVKAEITEALQEKYRKEAFDHWLKMILSDHYISIYL